MRTIVHLSDLHFGRLDDRLIAPLVEVIHAIKPDVIAASGDFTQRARRRQFREARAFLDALPFPKVTVPGNHDVPLYNLPSRVLNPFGGYRKYIADDLEPSFVDDEIALVGLNSARALITRGQGRLNLAQVKRAVARIGALPPQVIKVIVTHHPFDLPTGIQPHNLVGRSAMAMAQLAGASADLFLAGHLHVSHISLTAERYKIEGHSALVVQAGTLSTRGRGELNTFNVLRVARPDLWIERYSWTAESGRFMPSWSGKYRHTGKGWTA